MNSLLKLSLVGSDSNALSFLYRALREDLGDCTMALLNSVAQAPKRFQLSGFCDHSYCPTYSARELLSPSAAHAVHEGEFIEEWKQRAEPFAIDSDSFRRIFRDKLSAFERALVLPIWYEGEIERWLLVLSSARPFEEIDQGRLVLIANYVFSTLARVVRTAELKEAQRWIDREISEMARVQSLLLPDESLQIPGIDVAFTFRAYKSTSGDYLGIKGIGDQTSNESHGFGAVIADVSGHGPSAAVEAARLDAIMRTYEPNKGVGSPEDFMGYLNTHFFTSKPRGKFITMNAMIFDPDTRVLRYCSAGHPHPYIKRGDEVIALDAADDIPVGVLQDYQWKQQEFTIERGDILFMFTDVVIETRNPAQEEFSFWRLEELLRDCSAEPRELVASVERALKDFHEAEVLNDDLTLCAIAFNH